MIKTVNKWGDKSKNTQYGNSLEFRNHTKNKFDWDIEDDLDIFIDPDPILHPNLSSEFPGVILEEDTPGPIYTT